ncbi:MAG: DUF3108 domain-containing protein [Gammaproteobacteria bacterium]
MYLVLMLAIVLSPVTVTARDLPHEFSAVYTLEMYNTVLARATYTLKHTDNGLFMKQSTRPVGLVALLRDDKIDVRSDMVIDNDRILLVSYDYRHTGDDKDRNVNFKINWQTSGKQNKNGKVSGVYEGDNVALEVDQPVWDPLSIQVPLMLDAARNLPPHEHGMFLKGEFKYYLFENQGNDDVSFDGKEYNAVKIAGKETKRDRAMYAWLVPELHYLPVKIEQWKEGKLKSTVKLESVTFNSSNDPLTASANNNPTGL